LGVEVLPHGDSLHDALGKIDIVNVTLDHRILQVVAPAFQRRFMGPSRRASRLPDATL